MGHYEHYVDIYVTPTLESGAWYVYINGNQYAKSGAQRWTYSATTSDTISIYIEYATYTGTFSVNRWVEDEFTITTKSGTGGTLTANKSKATAGTTVTLTPTASSGYVFKSYTKSPSSLSISNNKFTMPSKNVTITANWWKLSTGSLNKKTFDGGSTIKLTITAQATSLAHRYRIYKSGVSGLTTGWVSVAAGTTTVNITIPLEWCQYNTSGTSITGLVLELRTYNGSTNLGTTTITGLTFNVPASVVPTIGTITTAIVRTVDGVTYGNIGDIYVQNHCGVRVQTTAAGVQGSTIVGLSVKVGEYGGNKYNKTVSTGSIDFTTTGVLSAAGTNVITITATDSRGRVTVQTALITVESYSAPSGSLTVKRVNNARVDDEMGVYGMYELTKRYSEIGTNTLAWTLAVGSNSVSSPAASGDLLPGNRLEMSETEEFTVTLTLVDGLETTIITAQLMSARFILAFDASGNKIGVMKYPNKSIPTGKLRTFEFSEDTQIYIGKQTLEDYIRAIVNS